MSYDISICVKVEGCNKYAEIGYPEYDSPTYNLGKLFRKCTEWDFLQGVYYRADKIIGLVEHGIKELIENPSEYEQYLPKNGWGTIDSALQSLNGIKESLCEESEEIPLNCLWIKW